jgi:hypothetical protein
LVGKYSTGNFFLFTCPACFAIPIAFLSIGYLLRKPRPKVFYLPILINMVTIVVGIILYQFEIRFPDYAFQQHYSSYVDVIKLVESKQMEVKDKDIVLLPEKESKIFRHSVVYSITGQGIISIYFEDGYDNFDNYSWGYIYRSDGNQPSDSDQCFRWRNIIPPRPNWYYCEFHKFVGFPLDRKSK